MTFQTQRYPDDSVLTQLLPALQDVFKVLREALPTHGWQAAPAGGDAGVAFLNNGLRARLFCTAPGQGCKFRIETSGKPAAP